MKIRRTLLLASSLLLAACGAEDMELQPLPPLQHPSEEARAGLPEVSGVWRFAGWELAPGDSAALDARLPALGALALRTQKRDSLAGAYVIGGGSAPLVGEARRDSVISLVAMLAPGDGRYLAGHLAADTLWVTTTSLVDPAVWPNGARVAFVRSPVVSTFVRIQGAPVLAAIDSTAVDSASFAAVPPPAPVPTGQVSPTVPAPITTRPGDAAQPSPTPAAPNPAAPKPASPTPAAPSPNAPKPTTPAPAEEKPEVKKPKPQPKVPDLLGVPVDSVKDHG